MITYTISDVQVVDAYAHIIATDPHTQYRLESEDHNHQTSGIQGGKLDHGLALYGLGDDDHTQIGRAHV